MNLIIDIGNTSVKLAVFDKNDQILDFARTLPQDLSKNLLVLIKKHSIGYAIISQVGKTIPEMEAILSENHVSFWNLSAQLKLPFKIAYDSPETLGADRLALVAGAIKRQKNKNQLIIDAGTCVTYDFIDKDNIYRGGAISPGIQLRYKSLHDYTAKLPLLATPEKKIKYLGSDTKSSIHSGVVMGLVNEIEGFIVKYNLKFKDLTVYLTGGEQKLLDRYIKNKIFVSSKFLLLEGLNYILNLNK